MDHYQEITRYLDNAREILSTKANRRDGLDAQQKRCWRWSPNLHLGVIKKRSADFCRSLCISISAFLRASKSQMIPGISL